MIKIFRKYMVEIITLVFLIGIMIAFGPKAFSGEIRSTASMEIYKVHQQHFSSGATEPGYPIPRSRLL